jgi:hypothetical protein
MDLQTATGGQSGQLPNMGGAAEVTFDYAGLSAEYQTGGVRINFIPRDGGNTFRGDAFLTFSHENLANSNLTDRVRDLGLRAVNRVKKNFDVNPGFGGPLRQDTLWYYATLRFVNAQNYSAGMFFDKNAFRQDAWTYEADPTRPALSTDAEWRDQQVRLTWQASMKNKLAFTWGNDTQCLCPDQVSATVAPEAVNDRRFPQQRSLHLEWSSPLTDRLLVEGAVFHKTLRWGRMHLRPGKGSLDEQFVDAYARAVGVTEQSTGLQYHGPRANIAGFPFNNNSLPNYFVRGAVSYVSAAHNIKVGYSDQFGFLSQGFYHHSVPYTYTFRNGVPVSLTQFATPIRHRSDQNHDIGLYAQDRWTIDRMTLTGGIRFDSYKASYPEQTLGPSPLTPSRSATFPAEDNLNWKDVTWRSGWSYDVFGDGKTAVKASLNKYIAGQGLGGIGSDTNPINRLVNNTSRAWTDANRNFFPDCDLTLPDANGECGPMANRNFGTLVAGAIRDPDLRTGWGKRQYNWEFSTAVQREILPRVSMELSYFRRWYGNFLATDDLNLSPADLDQFSVTAPRDSRLPDGGGQTIAGLFDRKPAAFGRPVNARVTLSDNYGTQIEHWNGFDLTAQARLQNGLLVQGGLSSGKTTTDNCEILAKLPEMALLATSEAYCHVETPMLTQAKALGSYIFPRVDVQLSLTFQSIPGRQERLAAFVADNAFLASSSTLGRPLSGGTPNVTIPLIPNGELYTERLNMLDMRVGKVIRFGTHRLIASMDVYNLTNADAITTVNNNYAALWRPTEILQARFFKFSAQVDF